MEIFDSHAHYDDSAFDGDREALLAALPQSGVTGIICPGVSVASSENCLRLARQFPYVRAAVGIHPSDIGDADGNAIEALRALASDPAVVAIGEIGLDYHYDTSPREVQRYWFEAQLQLAVALALPVIVHDREAHEDVLTLLRKYRPRGVVHCFSGSVETMRETVALGMYIGLGGAVTFKNARKPLEVAAAVPADRLLLETDAPYMAPVPYRGRRNDSAYIPETAAVIAAVRGTTPEELGRQTAQNARTLFGL
jgi:TatD DNase family protein